MNLVRETMPNWRQVGGARIVSDETWKAAGLEAFGLASIQPGELVESSVLFDA
jgi:hypothetical protein